MLDLMQIQRRLPESSSNAALAITPLHGAQQAGHVGHGNDGDAPRLQQTMQVARAEVRSIEMLEHFGTDDEVERIGLVGHGFEIADPEIDAALDSARGGPSLRLTDLLFIDVHADDVVPRLRHQDGLDAE